MRILSGLKAALLLGGAAATLTLFPAAAQSLSGVTRAAPPPGAPTSFADLAARLQPAVVTIAVRQTVSASSPGLDELIGQFGMRPPSDDDDNPVKQRARFEGSGFIISADGYVVTNNHVVAPANGNAIVDAIILTLSDGRELPAKVIGRDKASDLAVLKIEANNLPFVQFGDLTRTRVGDWVVVMGNPFGVGRSLSVGVVSALHRNLDAGPYDRYIQTDASINKGNSGGPMFDLSGNVIGINTILVGAGVGFAIPAEQARLVVDALRRGARPQRGYLGISPQSVDDDNLAEALGIPKFGGELVRSVLPDGPAARAGIQQGDVITRINGKPVTKEETVPYLVSNLPVGARVPFELIHDGQRRTMTVAVGELPTEEQLAKLNKVDVPVPDRSPEEPQSPGQRSTRQSLGLAVQPITPELARTLNIGKSNMRGVVVSGVDPSGKAAEEGIRVRDIILSINQHPTDTPEEVAAMINAARNEGRKSVLLLVKRGDEPSAFVGVGLATL